LPSGIAGQVQLLEYVGMFGKMPFQNDVGPHVDETNPTHDVGHSVERGLRMRQASLQYFTCSQSRSHFLRQVKGRPHVTQIFDARGAIWAE
jgi:hypothetical protein